MSYDVRGALRGRPIMSYNKISRYRHHCHSLHNLYFKTDSTKLKTLISFLLKFKLITFLLTIPLVVPKGAHGLSKVRSLGIRLICFFFLLRFKAILKRCTCTNYAKGSTHYANFFLNKMLFLTSTNMYSTYTLSNFLVVSQHHRRQ